MAAQIPLRNIWLLFLYAADLVHFKDQWKVTPESAKNLPELVARLLVHVVEQRLRRNLSKGYVPKHAVLPRVRGRINMLETVTGQLLERGRIACSFEQHTMHTPRNRLVRAALDNLVICADDAKIVHDCKSLSNALGRLGVGTERPSRAEMAADQIGRNEVADLLMVNLARMVFEVLIPSETEGMTTAYKADTSSHLVRRLFEKAVANALRIELEPQGWQVRSGRRLSWPVNSASSNILSYLPSMQTDIELTHYAQKRKVVIDTKFTHIFAATQYRDEVLKSGYLYQLYTYLRTQEKLGNENGWKSEGMLLHPQVDGVVDEHIDLQGHRMRFKTINLMCSAQGLEHQLRNCVQPSAHRDNEPVLNEATL
jgi:5-methylcytosine-specific restriction enzyme subunit McrC